MAYTTSITSGPVDIDLDIEKAKRDMEDAMLQEQNLPTEIDVQPPGTLAIDIPPPPPAPPNDGIQNMIGEMWETGKNLETPNVKYVNTPTGMEKVQLDPVSKVDPATGQVDLSGLDPIRDVNASQIDLGALGGVDPAVRAQQMRNLDFLNAQIEGTAPSVAQQQLQSGREANIAATMAAASSARGGANPLLQRGAMQSAAEMNAAANKEAALQRMQEQMFASGLLAEQAQGMADTDTQLAAQRLSALSDNAKFEMQAGIQNAQSDMVKYQSGTNAMIASADNATKTGIANMRAELDHAIAQGKISREEAEQVFDAKVKTMIVNADLQKLDVNTQVAMQELMNKYLAQGVDAAIAYQHAMNEAESILSGERMAREAGRKDDTRFGQGMLSKVTEGALKYAVPVAATAFAGPAAGVGASALMDNVVEEEGLEDFDTDEYEDPYNNDSSTRFLEDDL